MYQSKSRRRQFYVDMFPMFNVALIILMFVLIFRKPVYRCPIRINLPTAHGNYSDLSDADFMNILVGQDKIMLALEYSEIREDALMQMGTIYNIPFSSKEIKKFGETDFIGTPLSSLKHYIKSYYNFSEYYNQAGVLPDPLCDDELVNWILSAKRATLKLHNKTLRLAIEADGETPYPIIKNIINLLQKQKINKFSIIYSWQ